jgi:hypothetical protein
VQGVRGVTQRRALTSVPLAQVRVAPGRIVIAGKHYPYDECRFTLEQGELGGHFVIVVRARTLWERIVDWLRGESPRDSWPEGVAGAGEGDRS